jgi:hypothetical protein
MTVNFSLHLAASKVYLTEGETKQPQAPTFNFPALISELINRAPADLQKVRYLLKV